MTPELRKACEIVFQEHKISSTPIVWNKEVFLERLSWGLREMAKETLLQKKVIEFPNKTKRTFTILAAAVRTANDFEEAIAMAGAGKTQTFAALAEARPVTVETNYAPVPKETSQYVYIQQTTSGISQLSVTRPKWYLSRTYYHIIWLVCAAAAGAFIAYLLGNVATAL